MAETWLKYRDRERTLAATQVVPARNEYLGVWIHGIPKDCLKFFLGHARVPCFLIHELTANETPGDLTMEDFVQGTAIAPLLDWQRSEYNRVALRLNGGIHTPPEAPLPLLGIVPRPPPERLLSGSFGQWGPPARITRSRSGSMVSIPDSDDEDGEISKAGATVDAGTEWEAAPRTMILGTEVTIPMVDLVITRVLKFTVPGIFALEGMTAWLASATEQCGGYWTRMVREESQPRAYYYVEFDSSDAALRIKGLVNVRDGTVRLVDFVRETEFLAVASRHAVLTARATPVSGSSPHHVDSPAARPARPRSPSPRLRCRSRSPPPARHYTATRSSLGVPARRSPRSDRSISPRNWRRPLSRSRSPAPRRNHRSRSPYYRRRLRSLRRSRSLSPLPRRRFRSRSPPRPQRRSPRSRSRTKRVSHSPSPSYRMGGSDRSSVASSPARVLGAMVAAPAPMEVELPTSPATPAASSSFAQSSGGLVDRLGPERSSDSVATRSLPERLRSPGTGGSDAAHGLFRRMGIGLGERLRDDAELDHGSPSTKKKRKRGRPAKATRD
ncbi:hypothetical protein K438DRAFT_1781128 [Mycena galopus ATCC 62051]|nr:hypothetical protein K438DRAFT_1781128 [Mycena galopus ATCC 62051]